MSDKIKYNFGGDDFILPYDRFKDFKCSKHSWDEMYQHIFVVQSVIPDAYVYASYVCLCINMYICVPEKNVIFHENS